MTWLSHNTEPHVLGFHLPNDVTFSILYSRSVDPWKLRVGVKYYIVHMYSMPYYIYVSTANFFLRALIYNISKEWRCNDDLRGVGN